MKVSPLIPLLLALAWLPSWGQGATQAQARMHYVHHCTGCHQMDGRGIPGSGIPTMRGTLGKFLWVPGGREFIVQVPGVMNSALNDAQIAEMMNWLLSEITPQTVPPGTPPYTEQEVARLRHGRPLDVMATRQALAQRYQAEHGAPLDEP